MSADFFVDTNLLVYWRDATEPVKQQKAENWMRWLLPKNRGCLSVQVLQEYYVTVTRKLKPGLSRQEARDDINDLLQWQVMQPGPRLLAKSWEIEDYFSVSYSDSLILAAACVGGCKWLLSEDMQDGLQVDELSILNPFRLNPQDLG